MDLTSCASDVRSDTLDILTLAYNVLYQIIHPLLQNNNPAKIFDPINRKTGASSLRTICSYSQKGSSEDITKR